jgi:hypothetical protein
MHDRGACPPCSEGIEDTSHSGTFEPWLGGDRQMKKRVAKTHIPCQEGALKSVWRELPRVALVAGGSRMTLLRAGVATFFGAHSGSNPKLTECVPKPVRPAALAKAVTDKTTSCSMPGSFAQGV